MLMIMSAMLCMSSINATLLGRGINVVIVDSRNKLVIKVQQFDTYEFSKN